MVPRDPGLQNLPTEFADSRDGVAKLGFVL